VAVTDGRAVTSARSTAARPSSATPRSAASDGRGAFAILNQKGGTGKTTTAVNLAAGIADRGYDTLLVDVDAQGNVAPRSASAASARSITCSSTKRSSRTRSSCRCAATSTSSPPTRRWRWPRSSSRVTTARATACSPIAWRRCAPSIQYIVLDCGPSLSLLNQNALRFADEVLIPVSCDYLALVGVKQVLKTLKDIDKHLGHAVAHLGRGADLLRRAHAAGARSSRHLERAFQERLYEPIRRSTRLAEAPSHRQTIFEYAPDSSGADDYRRLVERYVSNAAPIPQTRPEAA